MSKTSFNIKLPWSEVLFLEGAKLAYDYDMRYSWRRYMGWFFIALTQFGVVGALRKGAIGLLLISTLLVIYWYALRWPMRKKMLKRFFRSQEKEQTITLTLSKSGICTDNECIPWDRFDRTIISIKGILLDMGAGSYLYLPRSILNEQSYEHLRDTLKQKVKKLVYFDSETTKSS